jgi:hypothetical protein
MVLRCRRFPRAGTNTEPRHEPRRIRPCSPLCRCCWRSPRLWSPASRSTSRLFGTLGSRSTSHPQRWSTAEPRAPSPQIGARRHAASHERGLACRTAPGVRVLAPKSNVDLWGTLQQAFVPAAFRSSSRGTSRSATSGSTHLCQSGERRPCRFRELRFERRAVDVDQGLTSNGSTTDQAGFHSRPSPRPEVRRSDALRLVRRQGQPRRHPQALRPPGLDHRRIRSRR